MQTWFWFCCEHPRRALKIQRNPSKPILLMQNQVRCSVAFAKSELWLSKLGRCIWPLSLGQAARRCGWSQRLHYSARREHGRGEGSRGRESVKKGKYWLKERRYKGECGRTVNEPGRMEKNSSATVIRLDFRSNCHVLASADTVGNICPQLRLQKRRQVVSDCRA